MVIEVQAGARILFAPLPASWPGTVDCFTIDEVNNVAMTGGGEINGQGSVWWPNPDAFRPRLLVISKGTGLLISNLSFVNSPYHNLELFVNDVEVSHTSITATFPSPNTDGIDVHGT